MTGKIPFKTNAAVSWRNPRLDSSLTEPLAYIVSNSSMYKFNFWSIPISQETLDIRYFLFDCVQANYKPHNPLFLGPSYKQAFIADDVYNKNVRSRKVVRHAADVKPIANVTSFVVTASNANNSSSAPNVRLLNKSSFMIKRNDLHANKNILKNLYLLNSSSHIAFSITSCVCFHILFFIFLTF